eukprot:11686999-Alexandrium_andersonii.AAC.1
MACSRRRGGPTARPREITRWWRTLLPCSSTALRYFAPQCAIGPRGVPSLVRTGTVALHEGCWPQSAP